MRFTRLRLHGFKSFVDPYEIAIEDGLTGVVGPNGCGKSNLVEALRWAMGESSAKRMRGGEMDDVIFGGTADRPPRNLAEVALALDNRERKAPAAFNDHDELHVVRRIERGSGSTYRINGREVRARDVHLLFADAATGNRSTALVRQGEIAEFIEAKPTERRLILEEAAGITGLYSRRHEAELRLNAAEANLARLDDVIAALEGELAGLKRQARQASRYRRLSDLIRREEALLLHRRWLDAAALGDAAAAAFAEAAVRTDELVRAAAAASAKEADQAALLPGLRREEAEAAARVHRLAVARDGLAAEAERIDAKRREVAHRLAEIGDDVLRERKRAEDAAAAGARAAGELAHLRAEGSGEEEAMEEALRERERIAAEVDRREADLVGLAERLAAEEAERAALTRRIALMEERGRRLAEERRSLREERDLLSGEAGGEDGLRLAEGELEAARADLARAREKADAAEESRRQAEDGADGALSAARSLQRERDRLAAEERALTEFLAVEGSGEWTPILDELAVDPGYEAALGAALGDDLIAPREESAPVRWRTLPGAAEAPALPAGIEPLSRHVRAPAALARRLGQIGVVGEPAEGDAVQRRLAQGQRLVSRNGGLWRWDGYTVADGATTAAALRLAKRNRLAGIAKEREAADARAAEADALLHRREEESQRAAAAERTARDSLREAEERFGAAHDHLADLGRQAAANASRVAALAEREAGIAASLAEGDAESAALHASLARLADTATMRRQAETARAELTLSRRDLVARQSAVETLAREAAARRLRMDALETEIGSWRERREDAERQLALLARRREEAERESAALALRPAEIAARRQALFDESEAAEEARAAAADRLAAAEARLADLAGGRKAAEENLAVAREERVRREARVAQTEQVRTTLAERIAERLACAPEEVASLARLGEGEEAPPTEATERRLERLLRERETMGPVNLRAESEARDLSLRIASLTGERADLTAAIARLRHGIASLNREGRERLLAAFAEVNGHFDAVFRRLFDGGEARLEFVESADPLEAGLELMASPPGKRPQALSLLSGGEQALTALSLLFAVFLTNPAPICVLDEVDAPLDDANVDRFCTLLEEIAHSTATRFLLVTHHRMTMARMDRLYGVTMAERGVSQLVSVDLQTAEELREAG